MITEDYVSFETAKLLKEKGFNIPCNTYFVEVEKETAKNKFKIRFCHSSVAANRNTYKSEMANHYYFSCPTLQMVMKWLREVHNIDISIEVRVWNEVEDGFVKYWKYTVYRTDEIEDFGQSNTPEEACEEAIRYCLENLI